MYRRSSRETRQNRRIVSSLTAGPHIRVFFQCESGDGSSQTLRPVLSGAPLAKRPRDRVEEEVIFIRLDLNETTPITQRSVLLPTLLNLIASEATSFKEETCNIPNAFVGYVARAVTKQRVTNTEFLVCV